MPYLEELNKRIKEYQLMAKVNSLTEQETGERLVLFSLSELLYVYEKVSPTEYEDIKDFIKKLLKNQPLLKLGSEEKEELKEDDFIYY